MKNLAGFFVIWSYVNYGSRSCEATGSAHVFGEFYISVCETTPHINLFDHTLPIENHIPVQHTPSFSN